MKKIISFILLFLLIFSCITVTASADSVCTKCYGRTTTRYKYQSYTSASHLRIKYESCSSCGSSKEVSRDTQSCFDRDNNKLCDQCDNRISSSPSDPSTPPTPDCDHTFLDNLTPLYFYYSSTKHEVYISDICTKCHIMVEDTDYESHVDNNHDRKCDLCKTIYTDEVTHADKNHDGRCDICDSSYGYYSPHTGSVFLRNEYEYVDSYGHYVKPYLRCNLCYKSYPGKKYYDSHETSNYQETEYEYYSNVNHLVTMYLKCDLCDEVFSKNSSEYHIDKNKDGVCDTCETKVNHQKHYDNNGNEECDYCGCDLKTYTSTSYATIKYKEKVSFRVVSNNLPAGSTIALYSVNDINEPLSTSSDGYIEWTSDPLTEQTTYVVKLFDKDGKVLVNTSRIDTFNIVINIDDSFFVKLISFFKELFGINMVSNVGEFKADY